MARSTFSKSDNYHDSVALGLIDGVRPLFSDGEANIVSKDIIWDLTNMGIAVVNLPANAGESIEVVSTSAADTGTLLIEVLGANGDYIQPMNIILNGVTPVLLGLPISRINNAKIITNDATLGDITFRQAGGGGTTYAIIPTGEYILTQGRYTSPLNSKVIGGNLLFAMARQGNKTAQVIFSLLIKPIDQVQWSTIKSFVLNGDGDRTKSVENILAGESLDGPIDIKLVAQSDENNTIVQGRITGRIFDV